ncbi:MAG: hypothetical protein V9G04_11340 [Nocardioides sp.]
MPPTPARARSSPGCWRSSNRCAQTYGGKVFDVLGEAFTETPLRNLLLEAIQYGERPDVKAKMHEVIDATVGDGLKDLLDERALASEQPRRGRPRRRSRRRWTKPARAVSSRTTSSWPSRRRFTRLGGRIAKREQGRYEIANVPAAASGPQARGRSPPSTTGSTFESEQGRQAEDVARADLLAPGHPLHDAVMDEAVRQFGGTLNRGTVLVSSTLEEPHLLVGVDRGSR